MIKLDLDDLDQNGTVGDWAFLNNDTNIAIRYGENAISDMVIIPISTNPQGARKWKWDGNREAPTLSPSIFVRDYPGWTKGWHGFLERGLLRTA